MFRRIFFGRSIQPCKRIWRNGEGSLVCKAFFSHEEITTTVKKNSEEISKKLHRISIDRSGLMGMNSPTDPDPALQDLPVVSKEEMSPLAEELIKLIEVKGPIALGEYMLQASNHSEYGYYHMKDKGKIGQDGDFITSPEISQVS